jgi:ApbE superfamily uncharacterized protein (UPF0280 family)
MTATRGFGAGAVRRRLDRERWHFQHGPIDCIVGVAAGEGVDRVGAAEAAVGLAVEQAWARFGGVLAELVGELPLLRGDLSSARPARDAVRGSVARRMVAACRPYAQAGTFITAMAAVAGSVAEELVAFFERPGIARAYVNNGGDIALHLAAGQALDVGVVDDPALALAGAPLAGRFAVAAGSPVRGIATSGWRGRSFSLGIADSVTVLATTASAADAAATIVANAVDVDDARIVRLPASAVRDDSDLGDRLVVRAVPALPAELVDAALARGAAEARAEVDAGRIVGAVLSLQGRWRVVGDVGAESGRDVAVGAPSLAPRLRDERAAAC